MTTIIMRHGQTPFSVNYLINSDPSVDVSLNAEGIRTCQRAQKAIPTGISTWIVTELPRTRQSANVLADHLTIHPVVEKALNELDYGTFDGGTFLDYGAWLHQHGGWARPQGSVESQREGLRRMLNGLRAILDRPAPRLVVAHGLLLSMLLWHRDPETCQEMPLFFPEAPHAQPLIFTDDALNHCVDELLGQLEAEERSPDSTARPKRMRAAGPSVATFKTVLTSPATKDSDHA